MNYFLNIALRGSKFCPIGCDFGRTFCFTGKSAGCPQGRKPTL